jgi:hypothetical protein
MSKRVIDAVAMPVRKANAQQATCFITFLVTGLLAVATMLIACVLPAMMETVTETICWISMGLEALSIALGYVAAWIKTHAL